MNSLLDQFANADHVYLVTARVPRPWEAEVNQMLREASKRKRVELIDWHAVAVKHPSYFEADGVHLNIKGARAYSKILAKARIALFQRNKTTSNKVAERSATLFFYTHPVASNPR